MDLEGLVKRIVDDLMVMDGVRSERLALMGRDENGSVIELGGMNEWCVGQILLKHLKELDAT